MHPAARVGDPHECKTHGPSPVTPPGCRTVLIGGQPAARQGDGAICPGSPDAILDGSPTVKIGNLPAARETDRCAHGGTVLSGCATVLIGNPAVGPDGKAMAVPPECRWLLDFGNKATGRRLSRLRGSYTEKSKETVMITPPGAQALGVYVKRVVEINGHQITIYEPKHGVSRPRWLPSADETAKGLATLSNKQLEGIKEVYLLPYFPEPGNVHVADFKDGIVRYYPRDGWQPQSNVDWAIQHESAHAVWREEAAKDPGFITDWQRAIDKDHRPVSAYGETNMGEDFADFMILYANVLGTPCEASARGLFKHRMAIMDKLYPKGLPVRNPAAAADAY